MKRTDLRPVIEKVSRRIGVRIEPSYHGLDAHRASAIREAGVGLVVDVGANVGQYASRLRSRGYSGGIVSFEPQPKAFGELSRAAGGDERWQVHGCALGARSGRVPIHCTADSVSSSVLLPVDDPDRFPFSRGVETYEIELRRLDDFELWAPGVPVLVKLDVQGFELEVIGGATETLRHTSVVECELSLVKIYEEQALLEDVTGVLRQAGFFPVCMVRGYTDPASHHVFQLDAIFLREPGRREPRTV